MAEGRERAKTRLDNLEAIEPLLGSLRVLSLSTMQMALNRLDSLELYSDRFCEVAAQLRRQTKLAASSHHVEEAFDYRPHHSEQILVILGSVRGIAGQYNRQLARLANETISNVKKPYTNVLAFGSRVQSALGQEKVAFEPRDTLSSGSMPDYEKAAQLIRAWIKAFESGSLAALDILSFRRQATNSDCKPQLTRLLPEGAATSDDSSPQDLSFPEPIIEGEPCVLLERIGDHLLAIRFYEIILEAIAAENLFRYRLLEEAKENTDILLEELRQSIQIEHRKEITQQLQELLVGSGMLADW